jgi:hypothetical protein
MEVFSLAMIGMSPPEKIRVSVIVLLSFAETAWDKFVFTNVRIEGSIYEPVRYARAFFVVRSRKETRTYIRPVIEWKGVPLWP